MNPPRVVVLTKFFPPAIGGVEVAAFHQAAIFAAFGADVTVITAHNRRHQFRQRRVPIDPAAYGLPAAATDISLDVRECATAGVWRSMPLAPGFLTAARRAIRTADLVHLHEPFPLGTLAALLFRARRLAVTFHSDVVRQRLLRLGYWPLLRRVLGRADAIWPTSPRLAESSPMLSAVKEKCRAVPLGVPEPTRGEKPSPSASQSPPGMRALIVGRLVRYKGIEFAIAALAKLPDALGISLTIVGDGPRRTALDRLATRLGVGHRVLFRGAVSDAELACEYAGTDVFVLPSIGANEAFGLVQAEAMARGLPVINTDLPTGVPWVSVARETGLTVPPKNAEALAAALRELAENPALRQELGRAGRARFERMFALPASARSLIAASDAVIDWPNRAPNLLPSPREISVAD